MEQEEVQKLLREIAEYDRRIEQLQRQERIANGTNQQYERQKKRKEKEQRQQQRQRQREERQFDKAQISGDKAEKYAQKLIRMIRELKQRNYPGAPGIEDSIRGELYLQILHALDNAALGYQAISRISKIENNKTQVDRIIRETLRKKW